MLLKRVSKKFIWRKKKSSPLSIDERVQVVLLYAKFESFILVQREWRKRFATQPPSSQTIRNLVDKFKETGSVLDRERPGRPRSAVTEEAIESVTDLLTENKNLSIRKGAKDLDMSKTNYYIVVLKAGFLPFRPNKVQRFSKDDFDRRVEFCETLLLRFSKKTSMIDTILWSDESHFELDGVINYYNSIYWDLVIINMKYFKSAILKKELWYGAE